MVQTGDQRRFDQVPLPAAGRPHAADAAPVGQAVHTGNHNLRGNARQPRGLGGGLLGAGHAGQRVAQQQGRLGAVGHNQVGFAAQVVHGGHHLSPHAAVQPAAVAQHGVDDLERLRPQLKRLLHQFGLVGVR